MLDPLFPLRVLAILHSRNVFGASPVTDYIIARDAAGDFTLQLWNAAKLGAQPTDPQISAISDAQANATVNVAAQKSAQVVIDAMPIFEKAILLTLLDQINTIRAALSPPLGAITPAQAIAAVRAKAGTL